MRLGQQGRRREAGPARLLKHRAGLDSRKGYPGWGPTGSQCPPVPLPPCHAQAPHPTPCETKSREAERKHSPVLSLGSSDALVSSGWQVPHLVHCTCYAAEPHVHGNSEHKHHREEGLLLLPPGGPRTPLCPPVHPVLRPPRPAPAFSGTAGWGGYGTGLAGLSWEPGAQEHQPSSSGPAAEALTPHLTSGDTELPQLRPGHPTSKASFSP